MRQPVSRLVRAAAVLLGCGGALLAVDEARAQEDWLRFPGSAYDSRSGVTDRQFIREWEATPPKGFPTLSAANIAATKTAIKRYEDIARNGGWGTLPNVKLSDGMTHQAVAILRDRLFLSGDLQERSNSFAFDYYVEKAVKRFQASNGLPPTGVVDATTVAALNVSADARLKQLKTNLTRLQELVRGAPKKYVLVNIPAAQIEAIENGQVASRHAGVVGKPDRPTPILTSAIHELNFNAVWHLPPTVITQDLIPKGREMQARGQSVLTKFHIDAYGADGKKLDPQKVNWATPLVRSLSFKQQPGPDNPLGFVKINFHNTHSVYMHDTPSQSLFGRNLRAASSGCVRIHGIEQLAAWLVAEQGWNQEHVLHMKQSGERRDVKLKKPVPLYFAYITAWATEDGVVQFRRDLYSKDKLGTAVASY
ncbi:MAG: L,D-transpeptidase family protein [Hyphomicrobiaceae bacterium]|nr:L,D-transpeptidase family protein [Hyphomicrobiaceae bacterium]